MKASSLAPAAASADRFAVAGAFAKAARPRAATLTLPEVFFFLGFAARRLALRPAMASPFTE
jgi:hypothetical protein